MKSFCIFLFVLAPLAALAEEGEHVAEHAAGIPASVVFQAINFVIFFGLGYYFLHKPVRHYFSGRQENFRQALIKAEHARREAEQHKNQILERLNTLESTSKESIEQARAEAESLRVRILQDAADLSKNLREEASRTAQSEVNSAKAQLRDELLSQSVAVSKKLLAEKIADNDQKRLQTEFVDKIQEVR